MKIMVFDVETTGLPSPTFTLIISPDTLKLWPHIFQLSYAIYDLSLNKLEKIFDNSIYLNENVNISEQYIKLLGNKIEKSRKQGKDLYILLNEFFDDLKSVDLLISHKLTFDINMLKVELSRMINSIENQYDKKCLEENLYLLANYKNIYCTMQEATIFCDIKALDNNGKPYLKYPTLTEFHKKIFECEPNKLQNSLHSILATLRCFIKFKYNLDINKNCNEFVEIVKKLELF